MNIKRLTDLLIGNTEITDGLLSELDSIARDYISYEYGLPMGEPGQAALMREAVIRWLNNLDLNKEQKWEKEKK